MANIQIGDKVKLVDTFKSKRYGPSGVIERIGNGPQAGLYFVRLSRGRHRNNVVAVKDSEIELSTEDDKEILLVQDYERILTDDPIRQIWLRLDVLSTFSGAKVFLQRKCGESGITIPGELLDKKALGLAYSIRNANEYFTVLSSRSITTSCLAYYYGTLGLLCADLLSRIDNNVTLDEIEGFTRSGHGLGLFYDENSAFPDSVKLSILANGFLPQFLRHSGVGTSGMCVKRRYDAYSKVEEDDKVKILSLRDLISRIPELRNMYVDLFREQPNYISFEAQDNLDANTVEVIFPRHQNSFYLTETKIRELMDWPDEIDLIFGEKLGTNGFYTPKQQPVSIIENRWDQTYQSVMTYECYIKPLLGLHDPLFFNFMLLYCLSIWVRYSPALWREVNEGTKDIYRPMFATFLSSVERIIPNLILDRIYNRRFLFAGHSYLS
jgi:YaaC-like Protein